MNGSKCNVSYQAVNAVVTISIYTWFAVVNYHVTNCKECKLCCVVRAAIASVTLWY